VNDKNKNLAARIATAVIALPIVLYLLYRGGYFLALLLGWGAAVAVYEYTTITLKERPGVTWVVMGAAFVMPFLPVWHPWEATGIACGLLGFTLFSSWMWHLIRGPLQEAQLRTAQLVTAFIYGGGGFASLSAIRNVDDGGFWTLATLVITWGNDTSAYFFGRFLGRHKLYPEVSPNKTWEGFFGGMLGGTALLFAERAWLFPSMTVVDCIVLGIAGGIFGPAGDLCESMMKRAFNVKDSGTVFPGHGGMLDRVDALLFNAPVVLLYVSFGRHLMGL